jgi:hypothetical protein
MNLSFRSITVGVVIFGVGVLLAASSAWACLSVAGITASPATVQPGSSVTVNGIGFEFGTNPILIHLDTLNGAVLGTASLDRIGDFTISVTLPANISNGPHILVATQDSATPDGLNDGSNTGVPARAVIQVGNPATPVAPAARPAGVITKSGIGAATLILIALAVAGVGLFLAGSLSFVASRRWRRQAEYVKAS